MRQTGGVAQWITVLFTKVVYAIPEAHVLKGEKILKNGTLNCKIRIENFVFR